jgi:biotin synthase
MIRDIKKWTFTEGIKIFSLPFLELLYTAQTIHREHFNPNEVQVSTLLNIKTGGCSENCSYCSQSVHHNTAVKKEPLMAINDVVSKAKQAKAAGSTRFCMGAAWRSPRDKDLTTVCDMISEIKKLGLETCVTLGMLKQHQAEMLKAAGLDFYNHNIDTSEEYYSQIVTSHTFEDRLNTLEHVHQAGIKVCCGGILGLGETNEDRIKMLVALATLTKPPHSIPINKFIKIPGTKLEDQNPVDPFDFVRIIALTRIMMPKSYIRLSAGRENMSDELQAICFFAGANSIFYGEKLLTANNSTPGQDDQLFKKLGLKKLVLDPML